MKLLKKLNIIICIFVFICFAFSRYFISFKNQLPSPSGETEEILQLYKIGLLMKNIGVNLTVILLIIFLLYVFFIFKNKKHSDKDINQDNVNM